LDEVRTAPFVLDAIRAADGVIAAARRDSSESAAAALIEAALDPDDHLTAIAAVHGLGRVLDDSADAALSKLLSHEQHFMREHAAWALMARLPRLDAIGRLVAVVGAGGFAGMVAQRTLQRWAGSAPDHIALALEVAYRQSADSAERAVLIETLGLMPSSIAEVLIDQVAADAAESIDVRAAALLAVGDRADSSARSALVALDASTDPARDDPHFEAALRLALFDATAPVRDHHVARASDTTDGLGVAQMFLHADLDRRLSRAGAGDNGGIATLLVRLGDALVRTDQVTRVLTLSRASAGAAGDELADELQPGEHRLAGIPLPPSASGIAEAWPARIAVERGLRRLLRHYGPIDAFHARMADVGSLAAQAVCREMGIPLVFSLAPDPHAVVHALDMTGALRRDNFGHADALDHYWFRIRLVYRLAEDAAHVVLFPRPQLRDDLVELVGVDIDEHPDRFEVVPEGIDIAMADDARRAIAAGGDASVAALDALIATLPPERHGLPLAISVGRLNRVKGMATVVEAWAGDADLRDRCNLVIVGGDLGHPSTAERDQLAKIASVVARDPHAATGLVLAGHQPNDVVARWLAATHLGTGHMVGSGGVYVCGSLKEEFGIALLEALAAGLVVVAPAGGGPATFVRPGVTGVLIDTRSPSEVASGIAAALDMATRAESGDAARATVRTRFTIDTMATSLATAYGAVAAQATAEADR
jgi:glycosyltransferase involved in cell wall biosynthesis